MVSRGVLRVLERYMNGQLETTTEQEDVLPGIQEETEFRFLLAHSATFTNTMLAKKLGYLSDVQVAEALSIQRDSIGP